MFPRENKTNCFPRDHTLSVYYSTCKLFATPEKSKQKKKKNYNNKETDGQTTNFYFLFVFLQCDGVDLTEKLLETKPLCLLFVNIPS